MRSAFQLVAERRWAGVGLALVVEVCLLVGLGLAPPSAVVGVPAALAAGIAGTVAVVFGVLDGIALAFVGALTYAAFAGWSAGELASLAVWPVVVGAVGFFAQRIERHRVAALRQLVRQHERERKSVAVELHEESAQRLAGALLRLRAAGHAGGEASAQAAEHARGLISETIQALRGLAVDLSPKALEDYGLAPALETLGATLSERTSVDVAVEAGWSGRTSDEAELTLYRIVQAALTAAVERGAQTVHVSLDREGDAIVAVVEAEGGRGDGAALLAPEALRERLRLLGGRLTVVPGPVGGVTVRAELPVAERVAAHSGHALP